MSQSFEGAQPRVVRDHHKYRGTKDGMLYPPIPEEEEGRQALNIMYDKRVFRGSTCAPNIIPPAYQDAQIFQNKKDHARAKAQARAAAAEEFFTRDVGTPEPLTGRQNIDVQTD